MNTMRKEFLPFALPKISEASINEVVEVLKSGWITQGPKVKEFETKFGEFVIEKEAIALNSATAGLHLCLEAIGLTSNDAVITSSVTFTASVEVICYFGAEPILTDVDPVTNLMTVETILLRIEKDCKFENGKLIHKATSKVIKAIIPVHLAGYTCDMEGMISICKKYNLFLIEDAAHAFPAKHKNKMIGAWGDFTVFSFYATKGITTGEGGMVTTRHKDYADRIRLMRLHGINRDSYNRPSWYYEVVEAGFKYNLTDIAAAIGIHQLNEACLFWERRTEIALRYNQEFKNLNGLKLPIQDENGIHSWHLYRIEIDPKIAGFGRDTLAEELKEKNIGCSLHFIPIYEHPFYKKNYNFNRVEFPNANKMYEKCLSLPLFAKMTDEDMFDVIDSVKSIFKKYSK